jgi:hypothetical protein
MQLLPKGLMIGLASLAIAVAIPVAMQAQVAVAPKPAQMSKAPHRVVIQISQNDPAVMNIALNNAENLTEFYKARGETVEIEFVAYGPGLSMVRSDTSPVKDRLAQMSNSMKNVTFSGCGNTLAKQSKQENKAISLLSEVRLVPAGIVRIVELEEHGWAYVRP